MMKMLSKAWLFYGKYERVLIVWVAILGIILANGMGRFEGKFIPIFDNFNYTVAQIDEDSSNLYLNFQKLRSECAFRSIEFFIVENRGTELEQTLQVTGLFKGREQARFAGQHDGVGPWEIRASKEQLQDMYVLFRHRCHAGFFTVTRYDIRDGVARRY